MAKRMFFIKRFVCPVDFDVKRLNNGTSITSHLPIKVQKRRRQRQCYFWKLTPTIEVGEGRVQGKFASLADHHGFPREWRCKVPGWTKKAMWPEEGIPGPVGEKHQVEGTTLGMLPAKCRTD